MTSMIIEGEKANLKALYIMGENPVRSLPQSGRIIESLKKMKLLIVQDILATETTEIADVVLPGAAFSEKSGSFTSMEGRIQCFDPVVDPPGDAKPDWEILDLLIEKTGKIERLETVKRIRNEISMNIPMYADLSGNRSESWIRINEKRKLFNNSRDGELIPFIPCKISEEKPAGGYPFKAILTPIRYHLGSGTRTGFSKRINSFFNRGVAEISPVDAGRMGLEETDIVAISSLYGSINREVRINEGLKDGTVSIAPAFNNNDVVNLLDLNDNETKKYMNRHVCDVRVERIP